MSVKAKYVDRIKTHIVADELIRGTRFDSKQMNMIALQINY